MTLRHACILRPLQVTCDRNTLALPPASKQAKSPTSVAVPKREGGRGGQGKGGKGGKGGQKPYVKREAIKEEEEEKDVKVKEEAEEDSDFPEVPNVFTRKRKQTSMYPANQYDTN
jgi:hypothetical protein